MQADYVIVGSGSAGSALAYRLSEDGRNSVIVLEYGGSDAGPFIQMPAALAWPMSMKMYNWGYLSEPEPNLNNRRITAPRGKVVGGSSSINGMVYVRGSAEDFDAWDELGAAGWSYADVLPYFKRQENSKGGQEGWRGTEGPLHVQRGPARNPLVRAFVEAGRQAGFETTGDYNGEKQEGFGLMEQTIYKGKRWSVASAYLRPALKRGNVGLIRCFARRAVIENGRAVGVEIERGGKIEELRVNKEIILSGGTINSPHLLMLSGIGPKKELEKHGIPVVKDLPGVGGNLQDHVTVSISNEDPSGYSFALTPKSFPRLAGQAAKYLLSRKGLLSSPVAEAGGFIRTQEGLDRPDVQVTFMVGMKTKANFVPTIHGTICHMNICRPKSRGRMSLRSASPYDKPIIEPGFLKDKEDVQILIRAIRIIREIFTKPAMAPYVGKEILPGREKTSDEDLEKFIRGHAATVYHPVGTCKMGPKSDKMAVVDNELRVHGIDGLRVADASIMPNIVSGNTSAPAMMIGERVAEFIQGKRNYVEQAA